jgi:hypothetical protein
MLNEPSGNGGPIEADVATHAHYGQGLLAARTGFFIDPTVGDLEPLGDFGKR